MPLPQQRQSESSQALLISTESIFGTQNNISLDQRYGPSHTVMKLMPRPCTHCPSVMISTIESLVSRVAHPLFIQQTGMQLLTLG